MNLYFHHVGQEGAARDFPKTVFKKISFDVIKDNLPDHTRKSKEILETLKKEFPDGVMNCWGVPSGARSVIRNLSERDAVLLVETTAGSGSIPALALVKAYWNVELRDLSEALWGEHKFPYIFFFDTQRLDFTWMEFVRQIGYKENFRPSGQFYRVNPDRLEKLKGASYYVDFLMDTYGILAGDEMRDDKTEYATHMRTILDELAEYEHTYDFLDETERDAVVKSRIGQGKFRDDLLSYWGECAVTGCNHHDLLRASHIKPWRDSTNEERLDLYNGLLLIPNYDIAFDTGVISFSDQGNMLISSLLDRQARDILDLHKGLQLSSVNPRHMEYLYFHRLNIYRAKE